VADCWFDSGAMPFAQHHYPFENKAKVEDKNYYPAQFISEAIDQTRGWFYTLLAIGVLMGKGTPYTNVICLGHINDKNGLKMSKSKGNIVDPWKIFTDYGADALRWHFYTINQPGDYKNFDPAAVGDVTRRVFLPLFNVASFYQMYQGKAENSDSTPAQQLLNQWISAKATQLVVEVTNHLENYHIIEAGRLIEDFVTDLSVWFLRRSRDSIKAGDQSALNSTRQALLVVSKLLAPFTPMLAEELYQQIKGELESVHLETWPASSDKIDEKVLTDMDLTRKVVELSLAKRDEVGIKIRQPLAKLTVKGSKLSTEYLELIKDEINVKEVVLVDSKELTVELDVTMSPELKQEGLSREFIRQINAFRKEQKLSINDLVVIEYKTDSKLIAEMLEKFSEEIKKSTISKEIKAGVGDKELVIDGEKVLVAINK
jgi:isoleucyl-tRNA synthetase